MKEFFRRIRYLLNRRRFDQELANDMEAHREMAEREGGARFGNTLRLREEARDAWGWTWIDRLGQDVRYAVRMLRKAPGFTAAAVLMLALGVGVNIAAFSFFDLMVMRPLQVRDPATLLRFQRRSPQRYASALPYQEILFFESYSKTLSAVLALEMAKLSIPGEERRIDAHFVTANFFSDLGATPAVGRLLDPERDGAANAEPVVVLTHGFWESHFGADRGIAGKQIILNGKPATIIGVASTEFSGLSLGKTNLWMPIQQQPRFIAGSKLLTGYSEDDADVLMWGRLRGGLTPSMAEEELGVLAAELRKQHPEGIWEKERLRSEPGGYARSLQSGTRHGTGTEHTGGLYPIVGLIAVLVLLILTVACGNLGSLLLARGVAREREISIRVAVGAGSGRLVRQLFTESLLLAVLGSAAGLFLGYAVLRGLLKMTGVPEWLDPSPDWRVVVFAIGISFLAAILFGLTPALQVVRRRHRTTIMRQVLVGTQMAGSCVLLIVAGLLVRALNHATSADPGFEYRQVVSIDPGLTAHGYSAAAARTYLEALESRLRGLPGVESTALATPPPLGNKKVAAGIDVEGRFVEMHVNAIDPGFFQTMKIPILRGRNLARGDDHAIVISESLARLVWPGTDAIGKDITLGDTKFIVAGICGSARLVALENSDAVEMYQLVRNDDLSSAVVLVKTVGPPESLAPVIASMAARIDPKIFPEVQMMKSAFRRKVEGAQYSALAAGVLGSVALLLACLGISGLVAYAVSQRTREIGIRMALGARPANVLSSVLRQFSSPVAIGLVAGVAGGVALSRMLRGQLYGISNLDPTAYFVALSIFVLTAMLSALVPARRALRVDPLNALRWN